MKIDPTHQDPRRLGVILGGLAAALPRNAFRSDENAPDANRVRGGQGPRVTVRGRLPCGHRLHHRDRPVVLLADCGRHALVRADGGAAEWVGSGELVTGDLIAKEAPGDPTERA